MKKDQIDKDIVQVIDNDIQRTRTTQKELLKQLLYTYAYLFPGDEYIQGMNVCAVPFVEYIQPFNIALWAFIMFMGNIKFYLPTAIDKFIAFAEQWEKLLYTFTDHKYHADKEHTLALKAGVFHLAPFMPYVELKVVWDYMFTLPSSMHLTFTAAFFAAHIRREMNHKQYYNPYMFLSMKITKVDQLVRRAKRTIEVYKRRILF